MREQTVSAIANLIGAVESGVPFERIQSAVDAVLVKQPPALRVLAILNADPGMLVSGSSTMPRALERIVTALLDDGGTVLRRPRCASCRLERELLGRLAGERVCARCMVTARRIDVSCSDCGVTRRRHAQVAGRDYCRICWVRRRSGAAGHLAAQLRVLIPEVNAESVVDAEGALLGGSDRLLRLVLECTAFGEWFTAPEQASRLFAGFHQRLRDGGALLAERVCGHCRLPTSAMNRLDGLLCCRKCYRAGHLVVCDGCGRHQSLERRLPDGSRLCQRCTNTLEDERTDCSSCGNIRIVAIRTPAGPLCDSCRRLELVDSCRRCSRETACRFAGTPEAICEVCATKRETCSSCGKARIVHNRTEAGLPVCHGCAEPIIEPCTGCGRERRVHGRVDGVPFCSTCYARTPGSFRTCSRCERVAHLRASGLCDRCTADDRIHVLFPPELVTADPAIERMRNACLAADAAVSLGVFRRKTSAALLHRALTTPGGPSHEMLDQAGSDSATRAVRSLLIEHGLLPGRDEHLARLERWITATAGSILDPGERRGFIRFARWRHLRFLRESGAPTRVGQASSRRRELALVVELLTWTRSRGRTLATLEQGDVDRWRAAGPQERHRVKAFLEWTGRNHHSNRIVINFRDTRLPAVTGVDEDHRWQLLASILAAASTVDPSTRLAAALVLLYGIRVSKLVELRTDDVTRRDGLILIRLGREPLALPDELGDIADGATRSRTAARLFGAVQDHDWLFPGIRAGRPLSTDTLTARLNALGISAGRARASALASLAQQLPPPILARLTGMHTATASRWAEAVSASNGHYAALKLSPQPILNSRRHRGDEVGSSSALPDQPCVNQGE